MNALRVESLWKNFGGIQVLQDVSFSLKIGECLALIGPNGAGKTTLINVISGELAPSKGEIFLLGEKVTRKTTRRRLQLGLAHSFQVNNLFFDLKVLDNVILALQGGKPFHVQLFETVRQSEPGFVKIRKLMESMGLWEKRGLTTSSLSYGEQRMMEIALSLASGPKVLLLDEPSAGLSESETSQVVRYIRELPEETAVLFVSHDMDVVFDLADKIIVLNYGIIMAEGKPGEIQNDPKVREIYLGGKKGVKDTRID